jgi:TPP-dependent pyruvate/acetoin dehydrogenase alpha subunit
MTYRWREHVGPGCDFHLGYRTEDEHRPWAEADPVSRMAAAIDAGQRKRIEAEVEAEIADAFAFAEASPYPEAAELMSDIFKEESDAACLARSTG